MQELATVYRKGWMEKCAQRGFELGPLSVSWGRSPPPAPVRGMNDRIAAGLGHVVGGVGGAGVGGAVGGATGATLGGLGGTALGLASGPTLLTALKGGKAGRLAQVLAAVLGGLGGGVVGTGVGGVVGGVRGARTGAKLHWPMADAAEAVTHGINEFGFNHGIGQRPR